MGGDDLYINLRFFFFLHEILGITTEKKPLILQQISTSHKLSGEPGPPL